MPSNAPDGQALARLIMRLCRERAPGRTICPSEVARASTHTDDWRRLMPAVRAAAAVLVEAEQIVATQRGQVIDPLTTRRPLRLSLRRI